MEVNSEGIVKALMEKPKAEETTSRKAVRKCLKFYTNMCSYIIVCSDFLIKALFLQAYMSTI